MNKKSLLLKIVSFLLLFVPFFINQYSYYRLLSLLLGMIIFCLSCFLLKKRNVFKIIFYPIFLFILLYSIDYACVSFLKRVPIMAYENVSESNFLTYNSILYRIYNCDGEKTLDNFYKMNYVCEYNLEIKDINAFLNNANQKYLNKFVTIKGKVSEVFGNDYIALQSYEQQENLAGQLTFNKNTTLKIVNNHEDLKLYGNYEIYDNVLVTGRILKINKNEITMYDAKINVINNFNDFTVNVIESKSCKNKIKELTQNADYIYYSNCLDGIYVKYDEDTIYNIVLALETKKLTLDKWTKDVKKEENEEQELYKFKKYNILKCKNLNTILIGNTKLKLNSDFCETINQESDKSEVE